MVAKIHVFRKTSQHMLWALLVLLQGCSQGLHSNILDSAQNVEEPIVENGQKFGIFDIQPMTTPLGTSRIMNVRVVAADDFDGAVSFSVVRTDIDALGAGSDVVITPVPSQVDISNGETKTVSISIEVRTHAPSFTNSEFHFMATEVTPSADRKQIDSVVALTVQNLYEILLVGGNPPEVWSAPSTASFRSHAGGIKVRFINMDLTKTHGIQGTGAVPPETGTMAAATPTGPGGSYEFTISPADGVVSGTYYCESHETAAEARTLNFNQP